MKIVKVVREASNAEGVLDGKHVHIIGRWRDGPADMAPFTLPSWSPADLRAAVESCGESVALADLRLAIPADPLRKIICVGVNYRDHAAEIGAEAPANPLLFTRSMDSLVAAGEPIERPGASETFDFEGEIAVLIGREGRNITAGQALDHVFGYTCFMDGSVRAYQKHSLTAGKNFWRSGSMGPWVVTADAIGDADLSLQTRLNGQEVQSGRATQMIFSIAQIIAYCSAWTRLMPGDVIATGTPSGVGHRRVPQLWMKPGDRLEVEIDRIGVLTNPVIAGE